MILRKYPDSIPSLQRNFIVHFATSKSEVESHISPLSIKCSMKGQENYTTSNGKYEVTNGTFLILNQGQSCSSHINSKDDVETFSIYFDSMFANESLKSLMTSSDQLLNVSFLSNQQPVHFFEKLYSHNEIISPAIMKLRLASKVNYDEDEWMKEQFFEVLEKLLLIHRNLYTEIQKLPPIKFSTKTELYRRICRAKEFIDSCYTNQLTIASISKEACLSQYHFLRLFKTVFKQTPHQYLTKRRIEKAMQYLSHTEMSITEICFEIGFESISSFSWLFRKRFGLSPQMFRNQFRRYMMKRGL
jgi:AraC-like DNA-binding protein